MNIANKVTVSRIFLVFIFMGLLYVKGVYAKSAALLVFLVAALTDYFDGYLAKKYNCISDFGKIMDPIADKMLTLGAFIAFVEMKIVPAWMVALIILRELVITSIRIKALTKKEVLPAGKGGKHKTVFQMFSILIILIFIVYKESKWTGGTWTADFEYWYKQMIFGVMIITTTLTVATGLSYILGNKAYLFNDGDK
ncbi:MAG: CDP-diacylglycerol--glycerol-3-phosphate 3-phosphatidyltransferase [Candidatus Omnitrophica bacterium]|nr:CDP-diacylglycerol--glycerol-3-phosphate 3-phosphatidyltransferase [Candidatus Omnitrophota bacterium]MDD5487918.1 CDP-diacylglycerol--glycerol-3-phosphate 3-phosphatidyltransferase [Candidatus Omnitrophota bacterium]